MQKAQRPAQGITEGVIWKQLLAFFFPILLGTLFQQLYNTADAVIVGKFVGKEALAAVGGATSTIINLFVNLFVGISSGATVTIARFYGSRDFDHVQEAVHTSAALALWGGAIMTVLGYFTSPVILRWMGTPEDVMGYAVTYIRVYFLGMLASSIYNIGSGILRAMGDTRRPLYFLIAACGTNIVLDLFLVVKMGMGVLGAAIATLISQIISAVLIAVSLTKTDEIHKIYIKQIRMSSFVARSILRVGLPAGIQSNMYAISNMTIQSCINSFGTDVMAAWTAFGKLDSFVWLILGAYGVSVTTFVGQNFGAQRYDRVRKSVRISFLMALGTCLVSSLFICTAGPTAMRIFTDDVQVLEIASYLMMFYSPFYAAYVCIEIFSGAIRGTGNSFIPMVMVCCGVCLFRVLWILFILPFHRTLAMVVISYPISWVFTSALFAVYYLHGGWMRKQIQLFGYQPEVR